MTFPSLSLRTQIILLNTLMLAILLLAMGFLLQFIARGTLLRQLDRELESRFALARAGMPLPDLQPLDFPRHPPHDFPGRPPGHGNNPPPPNDLPPPPRFRRDFPLLWFSPTGSPLPIEKMDADAAPYDATALTEAVQQRRELRSDVSGFHHGRPPLRVITKPFLSEVGGNIGMVAQIAMPTDEIDRAMGGLNLALLILLPVGLIAAGAGGAFLTNRVLQPVRTATRAAAALSADAVTQNDDARRLPVVGNDEFSELAGTFNAVLDRLATAFHEQQRLLEQQRRFTADASHELKTPLTVIRGNATYALDLPEDGPNTAARRHEALAEIAGAAEDMSGLVQDLLLLARADSGGLAKSRTPVSLRETLNRALNRVHSAHPDAAPVRVLLDERTPALSANTDELIRLFANLLDNALRHTSPDGEIIVDAVIEGAFLAVTVQDTGDGIAPEHLTRLGERFYRPDASRARAENPQSGSGLGLAICRSIAEAHGGGLNIESVVGVGTRATVWFRVAP